MREANQLDTAWMNDGGQTGSLIQSIDWSKTAVGPIESWPNSLKTTVATLLHSRHPMFLWWGPELIQFYNDAYLPSIGSGRHPAAMGQRGQDCWSEIWPIISPQIDDVMLRGRASWNEDHLIPIFRNGRLEEVYWTYGYSPVFNDQGAIGGVLVVCTETTARVVAERRIETLRALAEKTAIPADLPAMIDAAASVFSEASRDIPFALVYLLNRTSGQPELEESVGIPREQAMALFDATFRRELAALALRSTASSAAPIRLAAQDLPGGPWPEPGSEAFVVPLVKPAADGPSGFIVFGLSPRLSFDDMYRDYLTQLAATIALAHARLDAFRIRAGAERERNSVLLQAPVATALLTGPDHVFQLANPLYCLMAGRDDIVGMAYLQAFPEMAGTALPEVLDRVYRTGEPFVTSEYSVRLDLRGDGTLEDCFFKLNLEPLRDGTGAVYGLMAVAVDITEQVDARRVLERSHEEREKLLADLESASRAKDEFLAMLGHELRNPLSPIVTALQLMKRRGDGQTSNEQRVIERQVNHLVRLVDDLLDVSKITRGKVDLRKEPIDIRDILNKAVEIASVLFEQRNHQLSIDVSRDDLRYEGDPVRLAQVVANLLTNAARYTDPGGQIRLAAFRDGDAVVISVKDNGVGISAEMQPRIFDLFVQGTRSTDRAEGGLGIGLTLVKNLVALHGGTVVAKSDGPGKGSEFVIRLPTSRAASAAVAGASHRNSSSVAPSENPKRVLVVDDNGDAAELLCEILRDAGHDVAVANDPHAALALIETFKPNVAVLDIGLPVMDGYELAAQFRAMPAGDDCRLIALSGYGQDHDRKRSVLAGFERHLVKPVDSDELIRVVDGL